MHWVPADSEEVAARLRAIGCVAAEEEAGELLDAAADTAQLEGFLRRRAAGEPLAWITGWLDFAGVRVSVAPGVYVPRFESVELARRAGDALAAAASQAAASRAAASRAADGDPTILAATEGAPTARAVDLCTGSGAIAVALRHAAPAATVVGVDLDPRATRCARANGVAALVADATLDVPLRTDAFDVVTVVAPYVPRDQIDYLPADVQRHEPMRALDGGTDGLAVLRHVVPTAARLLRRGGRLFVELGGNQDRLLAPTLRASGFEIVDTWFDDDGDLRGLAALRR